MPGSSAGGGGRRLRTVDIARALAILGVVFGHVTAGLESDGLLASDSWTATGVQRFGLARMAAFFFLVGLFMGPAVAKRGGVRPYLRERLTVLLWTYLLWDLVYAGAETALAGGAGAGVLLRFWDPALHLWFLPTLALATVITCLLRPWRFPWSLLFLALCAVLLWARVPEVIAIDGLSYVYFVALGAAVGLTRLRCWLGRPVSMTVAGSVAAVVFVYGTGWGVVAARSPSVPFFGQAVISLIVSTAGVVLVVWAAWALAKLPEKSTAWLVWLGGRTIEIYVAHLLFVTGIRMLLMRMGIDSPVAHLVIGSVGAVALSLLVAETAQRWRMGWLYHPPRRLLEREAAG
ncbi:acyltransferase [Micrococcus luteus]|nr:acyltransferase [Micrococcus luteus]